MFYTDGSKTDKGVRIRVNGPGLPYFEPLGRGTSIFHMEVYAIMVCARYCLDTGVTGKLITILSDSQTALKALDLSEYRSKLVLNCLKTLEDLSSQCAVFERARSLYVFTLFFVGFLATEVLRVMKSLTSWQMRVRALHTRGA